MGLLINLFKTIVTSAVFVVSLLLGSVHYSETVNFVINHSVLVIYV